MTLARDSSPTEGTDAPALSRWLSARGVIASGAVWQALRGGRTNAVWRVTQPGVSDLICKLNRPDRATPLFPNDGPTEASALARMADHGLAPHPVATFESPFGPVIVMESLAPSRSATPRAAGAAMARVHRIAPIAGLRPVELSAGALLAEADTLLADAQAADRVRVAAIRPSTRPPPSAPAHAFLHGDPVPDHVLQTPHGVRFIDWQCPALGDPVFDLACFASPAMRISCDAQPLSPSDLSELLDGYGDPDAAARFHAWRPLLSWRFAAHAAWRVARGHSDYGPALDAELSLLEQLGQ